MDCFRHSSDHDFRIAYLPDCLILIRIMAYNSWLNIGLKAKRGIGSDTHKRLIRNWEKDNLDSTP